MSSNAQIAANRENAQKSTGPVTEAGKQRTAQNAAKHGFTGQTLVITPQEQEAYEAHVRAYTDHHKPTTHQHKQLVQQLADLHWSLHQIFVQQSNVMSLMTAITIEMSQAGDPLATAAALAPVTRTLTNLNLYEVRRRRAAQSVQEELALLETALAESQAAAERRKPAPSAPIGSVCSSPADLTELERFYAQTDALIQQLEAQETPEVVAELRRQAKALR